MEVICENCKAKLSIRDEKIPPGKKVIISCPKCNNKITLDTEGLKKETPAGAVYQDRDRGQASSGIDTSYDFDGEDALLESYEEEVKLALVMQDDVQQSDIYRQAIQELGYKYVCALNSGEAINKTRFHHFDLLILSDGFDDTDLMRSPVLKYMNQLSMSVRRRMFVALTGDTFKTMDQATAFAMSANIVINRRDIGNLTGILKYAISDYEKFYKVFMDILVETGKA